MPNTEKNSHVFDASARQEQDGVPGIPALENVSNEEQLTGICMFFGSAAYTADYRSSTKRNMPKHWFDPLPHNHVALDDAIEQRALFCNMLRESRSLSAP